MSLDPLVLMAEVERATERLLHDTVTRLAHHDGAPAMVLRPASSGHELTVGDRAGAPVIAGTAGVLAGWLSGRSPGTDLTVSPPGELPTPPPWI